MFDRIIVCHNQRLAKLLSKLTAMKRQVMNLFKKAMAIKRKTTVFLKN
jgi:hypothetical protein